MDLLSPARRAKKWRATKGPDPLPEAVVTGWHLLSGKERGGSDGFPIVTDRTTPSGRQRTARRSAVGRGRRLGSSSTSAGLPGPPFGTLLPSRLPRPIPAASGSGSGP